MPDIIAVRDKPFTEHLSDAINYRKTWDKGLKIGANALELSAYFAPEDVGSTLSMVGKEAKYIRAVLKLPDVIGNLTNPDNKDPVIFGLSVTEQVFYGLSDLTLPVTFGHDVGLWDLGEAEPYVSNIGGGAALVALGATVGKKSYNHVMLGTEIQDAKNRIVEIDARIAELDAELGPLTLDQAQELIDGPITMDDTTVNPVKPGTVRLLETEAGVERAALIQEKAELVVTISKDETGRARSIMDIVAAIFDIFAIAIGFLITFTLCAATLGLPFIWGFGVGSGGIGVAKAWMDQAGDLKPVVVDGPNQEQTSEGTPAGTVQVEPTPGSDLVVPGASVLAAVGAGATVPANV